MSFEYYTTEDSARLLSPYKNNDLARRALLYHAGDHFQNRKEWRGPIPKGAKAEDYWREIERCFVSNNVVKLGEERHNHGVNGKEPMWSHDPTRKNRRKPGDAKNTDADELDDYLVPWWDSRRMLLKFRRATTNLLVTKSGTLRLYISPKEGRGADAFERSLNRVYFTVPEYGQACVYTDPVTQAEVGVYEYRMGGERLVEYSYVRDDGMTVIRTVAGTDGATLAQKAIEVLAKGLGIARESVRAEVALDLGGMLHVYEMRRDALVTEQVLQNQGLLNLALTMLPRNVIVGGFLEAVYKNAAKPTVQKRNEVTGQIEEVETDEIEVGAGVRTFLVGVPRYDAEGNVVGVESVGVEWRNPVPVETFDDTGRIGERVILSQMHQKHVLEIGNESGEQGAEARKVARDDYMRSLLATEGEVNPMGRWALTVTTHAAVSMSGENEKFLSLRPSYKASVDIGPLDSETRRMYQQDVKEARLSRQTYMILVGITDDPDAELALIAQDTALDTWIKRMEFVKAAKEVGFDVGTALELAGVTDPAERGRLMGPKTDSPPGVPMEDKTGEGAGLM